MSILRRKRKFKPTFENGGFWDYYMDLEHQFEDFLENVPYLDVNVRVCSFRLSNILLGIGGHVDSAFKEMAEYRKFSKPISEKCAEIRQKVRETRKRTKLGESPITIGIKECLSAFESEYQLSTSRVIFKRLPKRDEIVPFTPFNPKTNAPEWWQIYNGLKHDFSNSFEKANLQITRDALAGAFLLNVRHIPSAVRLHGYGVIKFSITPYRGFGEIKPTFDMSSQNFGRILERKQKYPGFAETNVFIYDYGQ